MNIAIVGAGNGGKKVLKFLSQMDQVRIVSVIDRNQECDGIKMAKALGISCANDISKIPSNTQIIIEATGNSHVLESLQEHFSGQSQIVGSVVAELLMKVVDAQGETTRRLDHQIHEIKKTSEALTGEVEAILEITNKLSHINASLVASSDESKRFIAQSDDMIKAVNKLTQQIKILGLNANIEAARAGEHGRGFSVVATEVQKMSDSTSNFANQIGELLRALNLENEKITQEVSHLNDIAQLQEKITERTKNIAEKMNDL